MSPNPKQPLVETRRTESGGLSLRLRWHGALYLDAEETKMLAAELRKQFPELESETLLKAAVRSLYDTIKHGDEEHRAWLKAALDKHFGGLL